MPKVSDRRSTLLAELDELGYLGSAEVSARLGVSEMTIRRDFLALAEQGRARRVPGGLGRVAGLAFDDRIGAAPAIKRRIAGQACQPITAGELVGVDAGTTTVAAINLLPAGCTVVSHSLPALAAASARDDLGVISLGGEYRHQTRSFGGPLTRAALGGLRLDWALLGAAAVADDATWATSADDAETKRLLLDHSARSVLLVDGGKFHQRAPLRAFDLPRLHAMITDGPVPEQVATAFVAGGGELIELGPP